MNLKPLFVSLGTLLAAFCYYRISPPQEPLEFVSDDFTLSMQGNRSIENFPKSKKQLWGIFQGMEFTFYCHCPYQGTQVDIHACGYEPLNASDPRAYQVEWEHIVPAYAFGKSFKSWREGHPLCKSKEGKSFKGRKCAQKTSELFNHIEADMYNLVPAIGETNRVRSNLDYGVLSAASKFRFGACAFKTDGYVVEPEEGIRGFIARTYKYMDYAYKGRGIISNKNLKLFDAWDKMHPPTRDEIIRAKRIANVQGNSNPFVAR